MGKATAASVIAGGGDGAIVNIGSLWAHQAIAATPSSGYSVAKAGLLALTKNLAIELAPKIRVNAVAPAVVKTPLYEGFIPKNEIDQTLAGFDSFHPLTDRPRACPDLHRHCREGPVRYAFGTVGRVAVCHLWVMRHQIYVYG
jgi:NAD(P)-dependent dehydrogenase (short-subunit alcohol dehydrogenase family)